MRNWKGEQKWKGGRQEVIRWRPISEIKWKQQGRENYFQRSKGSIWNEEEEELGEVARSGAVDNHTVLSMFLGQRNESHCR